MKSQDSNKSANWYDDGDIPQVDLPKNHATNDPNGSVEPLPESSRPRRDGPGGE